MAANQGTVYSVFENQYDTACIVIIKALAFVNWLDFMMNAIKFNYPIMYAQTGFFSRGTSLIQLDIMNHQRLRQCRQSSPRRVRGQSHRRQSAGHLVPL